MGDQELDNEVKDIVRSFTTLIKDLEYHRNNQDSISPAKADKFRRKLPEDVQSLKNTILTNLEAGNLSKSAVVEITKFMNDLNTAIPLDTAFCGPFLLDSQGEFLYSQPLKKRILITNPQFRAISIQLLAVSRALLNQNFMLMT